MEALVLGTATSRGLSAAALQSIVRDAIHSSGWTESTAEHEAATSRLNRRLCGRAALVHEVAMFWAHFDVGSQLLRYINAGHAPPLLFKSDRRRTLLRLRKGGPVLGLLPQFLYQQGAVRLDSGDLLILYSEDLVDVADSKGEQFGEDRLRLAIANYEDRTPGEIRARILSSVCAFTGQSVSDRDRTLAVLRYAGMTMPPAETDRPYFQAASIIHSNLLPSSPSSS